ncbi:hypothetical protein B7Z00_04625 [Candidatus Saccharibacteria bacterium 32-50-10]|nr:MAG: hypothetical protein B7Z00_04625 [Candidatus Saccharibacteria bacterium 32-50-10]
MLGKVLALATLAAFVLLSALLQSTSPSTIHPVGILIIFILFYVLALGVLTFLLFVVGKIVTGATKHARAAHKMTLHRAYYFASVLALAPVMYIGVRSIGHTGIYELVLIAIFEFVACFYIAKR